MIDVFLLIRYHNMIYENKCSQLLNTAVDFHNILDFDC